MPDRPEFLFDRRCVVLVATPTADDYATISRDVVEVSDLRVQFKVTKTLHKDPNTAEISITNLSENSRSRMQAYGSKVVLRAGYLNTSGQIFVGDARVIDHTREGPDWITKIQAGDGERGYSHARVSQSFAPGVAVPDIVAGIGKKFGFDLSGVTKKLDGAKGKKFVNGYTAHGRASAELDKILRAAGYEWSIQDMRLQILQPGEGNTEKIIELSSDSGLIGSPEMSVAKPRRKGKSKTGKAAKTKPPVLKFKALLLPEIYPGRRIAFASEKHTGIHRVVKVTHTGDTMGGEWYSEGEAEIHDTSGQVTTDNTVTADFKAAVKRAQAKYGPKLIVELLEEEFLGRNVTLTEETYLQNHNPELFE